MDTPFTNAAKRGEVFFEEPMMVAFAPQIPRCATYSRQIAPIWAREPANASPNPSRMDFLPSSMTSCGISSYFVDAINFPTYSVRPGAFAKSPAGVSAPFADRRNAVEAITPREAFPKSRLRMSHLKILRFTFDRIPFRRER